MARLSPYPFSSLIRRLFRELERRKAIFGLPARAFFTGDPTIDLSVRVHGRRVSTPFGPAAGPHTQLAQNIVLSWLAGGRVIELKTVQVNDAITVPRPCIDVQTVGYNVEWSQELRLDESIEEYTKASMLIGMLAASGWLPARADATDTVFDLSVGYDFDGIASARVRRFIDTMMDASSVVERLRREIPDEFRELRDIPFPTRLSRSVTLSTFHGCPPEDIERIATFLLREVGVAVTIKFNPTLLGREDTMRVLHDRLGYAEIDVPDDAFERDTTWDAAVGMLKRLQPVAAAAGAGLGVKFTNTLLVKNHRPVFAQPEMYLSGPPLHVLAMHLVRRFRRQFADAFPISFSGGIDRTNFSDAVALGLVPVTACTDLLKPRGYARAHEYLRHLAARMRLVGASTIDEWIHKAYGLGVHETSSIAKLANTERYVAGLEHDRRYAKERNSRVPRKLGRTLKLFDCLTCDLCIPVCPNDANFAFVLPDSGIPVVRAIQHASGWTVDRDEPLRVTEPHQIGTFADFCNDCGNCDTFCPEDGGPYRLKPRFFRTHEAWAGTPALDGFWIDRRHGVDAICGRFDGRAYHAVVRGGLASFRGDGFAVRFDPADPEHTIGGTASGAIDLTFFYLMDALRASVLSRSDVNYVNSLH